MDLKQLKFLFCYLKLIMLTLIRQWLSQKLNFFQCDKSLLKKRQKVFFLVNLLRNFYFTFVLQIFGKKIIEFLLLLFTGFQN